MRILVLSDSHGAVDNMSRIVDFARPDRILHLGDCARDAAALRRLYPTFPLDGVPGNCDYGDTDEPERLIEIDGHRILMMHGHTRRVKYSVQGAWYAAMEAGAEVLLFGHTHMPTVDFDGTLHVMNPGTCSRGSRVTYGIITIHGDSLECATYRL